ncbi:uncharacterized protein LOC128893826 isoform X2 [Hylaeus anthracinus]|nr:uncharacterized protein LOC128893826 isoform X2 [Hylaeus anthracinus]
MNKVVKTYYSLTLNSIKLRNLITSSYACNTLSNFENPMQDTVVSKKLERHEENVKIFNASNSDNNLKDVAKSDAQIAMKMCLNEAITFLKSLYSNKEFSYEYIKDSKQFNDTCVLIHKNVRYLSMGQIIYTLKLLLHLNVPSNTVLIQTLLQFIKISINDLSILQILQVYKLLIKEQQLPLIKSLVTALPIVFRIQAQLELTKEDRETFLSTLQFAQDIKDLETMQYILDILFKNFKIIALDFIVPTYHALYILSNEFALPKPYIHLLHHVNQKIKDMSRLLSDSDIIFLLSLISRKVLMGDMLFYDENVVGALTQAALVNSVNFKDSLKILKKLNYMNYSYIPLLDHLSVQYIESPSLLSDCTQYEVYNFLRGLNIANHKPQNWELLKPMICEYIINKLDESYSFSNLATTVLHLLALDCYNSQLIEKVFTLYHSISNNLIDKKIKFNVLKLHQIVKSLYPQYDGVTLNENTVNEITALSNKDECLSFKQCLTEIVGGDEYIKSGLKTKLGHHIDYTIVVKPDGSPIAINDNNNDNIFAEELEIPPECRKLFIFVIPSNAYSSNLKCMHSIWEIELKSLVALMECSTVIIKLSLWVKLPTNEQRNYLQKAIQLKCKVSECTNN